jgi:hypothetical protein
MRTHALVAALAATSLHGATARLSINQDNLPAAIEKENTIALKGVLNNIGPDGSQAPGALAGIIVASPSTENPDCEYPVNAKALVSIGNCHSDHSCTRVFSVAPIKPSCPVKEHVRHQR